MALPSRFTPAYAWRPPVPLPAPIASERLVVRWFRHADSASLFAAVEESRQTLLPWLPWAETEIRTPAEATYAVELYQREALKPHNSVYVLGLFDKQTDEVVGGTGLAMRSHADFIGEVGWWIRSSRRGCGFATEGAGLMITTLLTPRDQGGWGLRRVVASCGVANHGSVKVAERLGLRREGRHRQQLHVDGLGWQDFYTFAVLAHEWDFSRHRARPSARWTTDQGSQR